MYDFSLVDGKAVWENPEEVPQEIKDRAERLRGKTYSKTQFQKMLDNPTPKERIEALEKASGTGGQKSEKGIASRLDDFEDRITKLEE